MNLEAIRSQLIDEQQELTSRLKKIENDMERGHSRDWDEQAQERENDEVLDSLSVEAQAQLKRVNNALDKIDNNQYGYCERCHQAIKPSRLEALPTAEYCLDCAD